MKQSTKNSQINYLAKNFLISLFLVLVFLFGTHQLNGLDQDLGIHLTTGKIIWETKTIPTTNLFSYTAPGWPVYSHHWIARLILYLVSTLFTLKGLILFNAILWVIIFWLSIFTPPKPRNIVSSIFFGILSLLTILDRTAVRPEIFSFLLWAWFIFVLIGRREKLLWTLPLVQLVWVNTHIYFFLGPMAISLYTLNEVFILRKTTAIKQLVLTSALVFMVNLLNPLGISGAIYPILVFKNYGLPILENFPVWKVFSYPFLVFTTTMLFIDMAVCGLTYILNRKNIRSNIFSLSIVLASGGLALAMIRNSPIFVLVALPAMIQNITQWRPEPVNKPSRLLGAIVMILILGLWLTSGQFFQQFGMVEQFGLNVPTGPNVAVDFIKNNNLKGPMFNNTLVGSFLIWKLPEEKVFIDTRTEAYPTEFIKSIYIPMQADANVWKSESEKYKINFVFFSQDDMTWWAQRFIKNMIKNPDWPLVYFDGKIAIFVKNTEKNQEIIDKTVELRKRIILKEYKRN